MSSEFAMDFGAKYGNEYGRVIDKWSRKLDGVDKITDSMRVEWGADLEKALGEQVSEALRKQAISKWKGKGVTLPSDESLERFVIVSTKRALISDTNDLLKRLQISSNTIVAAPMSPIELVKRAGQTVAQILDMSFDRFDALMFTALRLTGQVSNVRRWNTSGTKQSRHGGLNGEEKEEGEFFTYNGNKVYGPRPPGGDPGDWSNCSCYLTYRTNRGKWL